MRLEPGVSRIELTLLVLCYLLSVVCLWRLGMLVPARLLLFLVLTVGVVRQARQALLRSSRSVLGLRSGPEGGLQLTTPRESIRARLSRIRYRSYWLTVLEFVPERDSETDGERGVESEGKSEVKWTTSGCLRAWRNPVESYRLMILPDSLALEQRKQLAVFLHCQERRMNSSAFVGDR